MHELAPYFGLLSSFDNANAVAIDLAHNVFLVGSVLSRKPERVLELGVGSGYVTSSLLYALRYNRKGKLTSVDNWFDWNGAEPAFASAFRAQGVSVIVSGEEEFVRSTPDDAYDFLVSDADHFQSHSWLDQHLRIVEHDGFLFFHDTNQPRTFPGLASIEAQLQARGLPSVHFKESSRPEERCQRGWLFAVNKKSMSSRRQEER
jgi:predicted O-methyltransferase YrrM